jgi:hypothetical protein
MIQSNPYSDPLERLEHLHLTAAKLDSQDPKSQMDLMLGLMEHPWFAQILLVMQERQRQFQQLILNSENKDTDQIGTIFKEKKLAGRAAESGQVEIFVMAKLNEVIDNYNSTIQKDASETDTV